MQPKFIRRSREFRRTIYCLASSSKYSPHSLVSLGIASFLDGTMRPCSQSSSGLSRQRHQAPWLSSQTRRRFNRPSKLLDPRFTPHLHAVFFWIFQLTFPRFVLWAVALVTVIPFFSRIQPRLTC